MFVGVGALRRCLYTCLLLQKSHNRDFHLKMEAVNEIIEICDIDTGELLVQSRKTDIITSDGLKNFGYFYQKFLELIRDGRNVSINCTAFDVRHNLRDAEDLFINFKYIDGIF